MASTHRIPEYPPFQHLTATNRGPAVVVATYIYLVIAWMTVLVQLWMKVATSRKLTLNDTTMIVAILIATAQSIALTIACNNGLGRHIDDLSVDTLNTMSQAYYASNILLVLSLAAAETSVIFLIMSIKPAKSVLMGCRLVLTTVALWAGTSVLALAFQCSMPQPWALGPRIGGSETCIDQYGLQIGIACTNILTDLAIIALPLVMMSKVQTLKDKKLVVSILFGLRIFTPAFAITAIIFFGDFYHSFPQDRSWFAVTPAVWTQLMLNVSIVTACIPSIKRFLGNIRSGLTTINISPNYEATRYGRGSIAAGKAYAPDGGGLASRITASLGFSMHTRSSSGVTSGTGRSRPFTPKSQHEDLDFDFGRTGPGSRVTIGTAIGENNGADGLTEDVIMHTIDYRVEFVDSGSNDEFAEMVPPY
jgi:hypothetical protein